MGVQDLLLNSENLYQLFSLLHSPQNKNMCVLRRAQTSNQTEIWMVRRANYLIWKPSGKNDKQKNAFHADGSRHHNRNLYSVVALIIKCILHETNNEYIMYIYTSQPSLDFKCSFKMWCLQMDMSPTYIISSFLDFGGHICTAKHDGGENWIFQTKCQSVQVGPPSLPLCFQIKLSAWPMVANWTTGNGSIYLLLILAGMCLIPSNVVEKEVSGRFH